MRAQIGRNEGIYSLKSSQNAGNGQCDWLHWQIDWTQTAFESGKNLECLIAKKGLKSSAYAKIDLEYKNCIEVDACHVQPCRVSY